MNAMILPPSTAAARLSTLPPLFDVSDFDALMTYQAPAQRRHIKRQGESAAREAGLDTECATNADELS